MSKLALVLVVIICLAGLTVSATAKETRRVLVLYEAGFSFPDIAIVDQEIREALDKSPYQIELYTENMEEILFPDEASQQEIREWYIHKYQNHKPDLIIAEGPPALKFMVKAHERFFPGTPIIFCCSPQREGDELHPDSSFTGMWMELGPAETLEVALQLQPRTKHVVVIGGVSSVDRNVEKITLDALRKYEGSLEFIYLTDLGLPELLERLKHLPDSTIIFYTSLSRDAAGTPFIDSTESLPMILSVANAPVFVLNETFLGRGEVGGSVTSFSAQGRVVGEIAMRILRGEKPENIPIVKNTNIYEFDWAALQRWGLKASGLPSGSIVLNRQPGVWEAYKGYIIGGISVVLVETLLIVGLVWQRARRKKVEADAEDARLRHSAIVQSSNDAIISIDLQGIITDWNTAAERIYGYAKEEAVGQKIDLIVPPELRNEEAIILTRLGAGESIQHFETVRVRKDGSRVNISLTFSPIIDLTGRIVGASKIARDISDTMRVQEDLQKSYAEVRQLKEMLQAESEYLQEEIRNIGRYEEIVGRSEVLGQVLEKVEQVAPTDSVVLITGESGTGKELIARAIHDRSRRKDRAMVKIDCATLPPTLIESELFGREKGAYTGALTRQSGRFETADGSTLFLDEIGELGIDMQAKLLRVVQDGDFERLGSPKTTHVNVRLIAATHRDLAERVRNGTFREDLFYRLNVFPIRVPPLRERLEDVPLLVTAFLREFEKKMGKKACRVPSRTMDELRHYPWPGNIRELRNVIERAVILTTGENLNLQLPRTANVESTRTLKESECQHIVTVLEKTGWRIKGPEGAAAILGMKPSTLYTAMRRLQIPTRHEKDGMQS